MEKITKDLLVSSNINSELQQENNSININLLSNNNLDSQLANNDNIQRNINQSDNIINSNINNSSPLAFNLQEVSGTTVNSFIHIKFSVNEPTSNEDMLDTSTEEVQYMGVNVNYSLYSPLNYTSYNWVKIKGEQGIQGEKGDTGANGLDGTAYVNIINPLYITSTLDSNKWEAISSSSRTPGVVYYQQKINIIDTNFNSTIITNQTITNLTNNELMSYLKNKLSSNASYIVDLVTSENINIGLLENEQWSYITRTYIELEESDMPSNDKLWLYFECYANKPTIDLNYQLKVI